MDKNKLLVFIPLYHPSDDVVQRIDILNCYHISTIAWKNSPLENFPKYYVSKWEYVRFFGDETNKGIGGPLKEVELWAVSEGYSYLLFFDQDTDFTLHSITHFFHICLQVLYLAFNQEYNKKNR